MISFIFGFFVGGFVGVMGMAILAISKDADNRAEEMRKKEGIE
jgi:hypothetical protein